jgi:hypothetical protein
MMRHVEVRSFLAALALSAAAISCADAQLREDPTILSVGPPPSADDQTPPLKTKAYSFTFSAQDQMTLSVGGLNLVLMGAGSFGLAGMTPQFVVIKWCSPAGGSYVGNATLYYQSLDRGKLR